MKMRNLIIACVILAALTIAVYWANKHPNTSDSGTAGNVTKLLDFPESQIDQVDITRKGSTLVVKKQGSQWVITEPEKAGADQAAVSGVLAPLSPLNADTVVEDHATNFDQYGLATPAVFATIRTKKGQTEKIAIGNEVPAASLVYVRLNDSPKIYAVTNSLKTAMDRGFADIRDRRLLPFDSDKITAISIGTTEFTKNAHGDWQISKPQSYRADSSQVEDLIRKLGDAKMEQGAGDNDVAASSAYLAGQPVGIAKVTVAGNTETLDVHKNRGDYYAKSSVVPGIHKISAEVGQLFDKTVEDYRSKKMFDFGFNDPNSIDIQQGSSSKHLVLSGTDWKLNGQNMDPGSVQTVIDKLRELSATKFVTSGFTTPAATVTVVWKNGSRTDTVEFSKAAGGYIARRDGEATLYQLDTKSVDDILEAAKAIKPASKK